MNRKVITGWQFLQVPSSSGSYCSPFLHMLPQNINSLFACTKEPLSQSISYPLATLLGCNHQEESLASLALHIVIAEVIYIPEPSGVALSKAGRVHLKEAYI